MAAVSGDEVALTETLPGSAHVTVIDATPCVAETVFGSPVTDPVPALWAKVTERDVFTVLPCASLMYKVSGRVRPELRVAVPLVNTSLVGVPATTRVVLDAAVAPEVKARRATCPAFTPV